MRSRILLARPLALLLFVGGALGSASPAAAADYQFFTPDWYLQLTDFGYSDFLIYTTGSFPRGYLHEMLSGELGAAVAYDGLEAQLPPPQKAMWLEPDWLYPIWTTNSTFFVEVGLWDPPTGPPFDRDGDGMVEGRSQVSNGEVRIRLDVDPEDTVTGTPIGVRAGLPVISNRYVILLTYEIENVSGHSLANVRFFQFLHAHPANSEIGNVSAFYDPALYGGARSEFRYDVTQRATASGATDGSPTGCQYEDHVNVAGKVAPADFGLGHFRGHLDRPATGLHDEVERDVLANQLTFGPDEAAGAMRWDLGTLASGQKVTVNALVAVGSTEVNPHSQVTNTSCVRIAATGADPEIEVDRGACTGSLVDGPYDVITGRLRGVQFLPFVQTRLYGATCRADDLAADRITLTDTLSPCLDALFILARRGGGAQLDYGAASDGAPRMAPIGCP